MSTIMNRIPLREVRLALAMMFIWSCAGDKLTGVNNFDTGDLAADGARVVSVTVSILSPTIAVGDTTRATVIV